MSNKTPSADRRPVILITGGSQGLGEAMARRFSRWATVYGTSRKEFSSSTFHCLKLDVTDEQSVTAAVETVVNEQGRIDILINNAGIALTGAVEMTPVQSSARQLDVNFFGAIRTTQAVLPQMRKQDSGLVLNISSMAAAVPYPFRSTYAASKAALEAWAWGLRLEVAPYGIAVSCVQVGECQTKISERERAEFPAYEQGTYQSVADLIHTNYRKGEARGMLSEELARSVERIIRLPRSKIRFRYSAGPLTQRILFACRHFLPQAVVEAIVRKMFMTAQS